MYAAPFKFLLQFILHDTSSTKIALRNIIFACITIIGILNKDIQVFLSFCNNVANYFLHL